MSPAPSGAGLFAFFFRARVQAEARCDWCAVLGKK